MGGHVTGAVLREYVYFGLMPVAFVSYDAAGTASVNSVHTDQVNMPQKLTDAGGAVVHDRVTTPFGETISVTGVLTQTLRFPGQRNDSETGLFQNWHRDYDASLGRYVQSDPIGLAGGINTYAYVGGNPVSFIDPHGLDFKSAGEIGHGSVFGPVAPGTKFIVDLPGERVICTCDGLPPGEADVDFILFPDGELTKIVDGTPELGDFSAQTPVPPMGMMAIPTGARSSNYRRRDGNSVLSAVTLSPGFGAFSAYDLAQDFKRFYNGEPPLPIPRTPLQYVRALNDGREDSFGNSCVGQFSEYLK